MELMHRHSMGLEVPSLVQGCSRVCKAVFHLMTSLTEAIPSSSNRGRTAKSWNFEPRDGSKTTVLSKVFGTMSPFLIFFLPHLTKNILIKEISAVVSLALYTMKLQWFLPNFTPMLAANRMHTLS